MRSCIDMGSHSELNPRARPSAELLERLRAGKAELRVRRTEMPLREKVAQLLELQRLAWPLLRSHRELRPWEHPWEIEP